MSVDFPNEAAGCQRFLSGQAQSNYARAGKHGPAAGGQRIHSPRYWATYLLIRKGRAPIAAKKLSPCDLDENTRSKDRVRGTISSFRAVAQLGRAPGSGPGGRGFKSHQPDF